MDGTAELQGDLTRILKGLAGGQRAALRALDLAVGIARARVLLRGARLDGRVYVGGPMRVIADGDVTIGHLVCFFGGMIATELICHEGAEAAIGGGSEINYGVSIEARRRVAIGRRCKIGSMVHISDSARGVAEEVVIGDDVWIAHGAIIEPGVTLGNGVIVSAGSVVTGPIPAGSLAVGNPARPVRLEALAGANSR